MIQDNSFLIPLKDISCEGKSVRITNQEIWTSAFATFNIDAHIETPLTADLTLIKTEEGVLVRGILSGVLILPCSRCTEPTHTPLTWEIESFESLPEPDLDPNEQDLLSSSAIVLENGNPILDLSKLLREECSLALPMNPLCRPDCKGLCPSCGQNLNSGQCSCQKEGEDPRMAIFRQIQIAKTKNSSKKL